MLINATIQTNASERRSTARYTVRLQTAASGDGEKAQPVEIRDLSSTGFLMNAEPRLSVGEMIGLQIAEKPMHAEVVWVSGTLVGCQFKRRLTKAQLSAALLRSEPKAKGSRPDVEGQLRSASEHLLQVSRDLDSIELALNAPTDGYINLASAFEDPAARPTEEQEE